MTGVQTCALPIWQVTSGRGCPSEWRESVIRIQPVIAGNIITPGEQRVCGNSAGKLEGATLTGGTGDYHYQWQVRNHLLRDWTDIPNHATDRDYTPDFVHSRTDDPAESYHDYYYQRYVTSGECKSWSNEVKVRFDLPASPSRITTGDKTGDDALKFKFTDILYAEAPETGVGKWTSDNAELTFDQPGQPTVTVKNLQLGANIVYWTVTNGVCESPAASVTITVQDAIVPTGFSPGGDNLNDCFRVVGAENAVSSEIIIFDRYNNIVFESKSFKGSASLDDCTGWWDGRNMSGNELPAGTYAYQVTLNGNKVYKGYVVLKR